jgi:DNA repair exonuclease SbcCD nuclease subunit
MRKDVDFLETVLGKMQYVLSYGRKKKADAILVPGDLLHNPNQTPRARTRFVRLCREYDIPWIVTVGDHDVPQKKRSHLYADESDLGTFAEFGIVNVLYGGSSWEFNDIVISGWGKEEPETLDLLDGLVNRPKRDDKFRIALVHAAYGGTAEKMGRGKQISACQIKGVDLALFGDIHDDPWVDGYQHRSGTVSYNVGSMVRLTKAEMNRQVGFLEIDINKDIREESTWSWTAKFREIPMLSAEAVFDVETIQQEIAQSAQNFQAAIAAAKEGKSEPAEQKLYRVASEASFRKEAADIAVNHLERE